MIRLIATLLFVNLSLVAQAQVTLYDQLEERYTEEDYETCRAMEAKAVQWAAQRSDTLAANVYYYLADVFLKVDSLAKAVHFFEQEKLVRKNLMQQDEEDYGTVLYNLTYLYLQSNEYEKGKLSGQELLAFDRKAYGITSEEYFNSALNYVSLLADGGDVAEAEKLLKGLLDQNDLDPFHRATYTGTWADICSYAGEYKKSGRLFDQSLALFEQQDETESEIYTVTLSNYASLLMHEGKYDLAEALFDQVLNISKDKEWFTPETYYATLNNIALTHLSLGQYQAGEHEYRELLVMDSITLGIDHPDYSITLSNLGLLYLEQGKFNLAEQTLKKSLAILVRNKDVHSISYAKKLNNLAKVYQQSGNQKEAIRNLTQAREIFETHFGKQSPEYATVTYNLGVSYLLQKSTTALPFLKDALSIRLTVLGKSHPLYAEVEEKIAQYYWMQGDKRTAAKGYESVFENYFHQTETYLPSLTEEEKVNFFYQKIKPSLERFATLAWTSNTSELSARLYEYHINTKGLVITAMEKVRQSIRKGGDTTLIKLYDDWEMSKDKVAHYYSIHESPHKIDSVIRLSAELEKELVRKSAIFSREIIRSRTSWQAVQQKLKPGEAAVECLRFRVFDPTTSSFTDQINYALFLLTPDMKNGPLLIPVFNGKEIETRLYTYYKNAIKTKVDDVYAYKFFIEPLHDNLKLRNISKIYFSPDGVYNVININSLKNPFTKKYVLEELDVRLVTSTRALAEDSPVPLNRNRAVYLYGFPDYNLIHADTVQKNPRLPEGNRSFRGKLNSFLQIGSGIPSLPGTKLEIEGIAHLMKQHSDSVYVRLNATATESDIKTIENPEILHIGTHGYFLETEENADGNMDPLLLSGLILAGAENFITTGINPLDPDSDGILTAYEAMNLKLDTKLVVLSACETALGKILPGEGVYGLQRAFQIAGAESIIMSLWNVDDAATQYMMTKFYEQYLRTGNLHESFKHAQLELKLKYPEPFYWAAFILIGKGYY